MDNSNKIIAKTPCLNAGLFNDHGFRGCHSETSYLFWHILAAVDAPTTHNHDDMTVGLSKLPIIGGNIHKPIFSIAMPDSWWEVP